MQPETQNTPSNWEKFKGRIVAGIIAIVAIIVGLFGIILKINNTENIAIDSVLDGQVVIMQFTKDNATYTINAEAAVTQQAQETGLMNRNSLASDRGMLFIFSSERDLNFWMKNTLIPLDIIFLDHNFKVVSIAQNTTPNQTTPTYESGAPAQYALEVNAGWTNLVNLQVGDTIAPNSVQ